MEEVAKQYIADPSLIWGLSFAVVALAIGIIWLVRFILFKMTPVLQEVAVSNVTLSKALDTLSKNLLENSEVTEQLIREQQLLNQQMNIVINRKP